MPVIDYKTDLHMQNGNAQRNEVEEEDQPEMRHLEPENKTDMTPERGNRPSMEHATRKSVDKFQSPPRKMENTYTLLPYSRHKSIQWS